jgi:hypothetical protein
VLDDADFVTASYHVHNAMMATPSPRPGKLHCLGSATAKGGSDFDEKPQLDGQYLTFETDDEMS